MSNSYLSRASEILKKMDIKMDIDVKSINQKSQIRASKNFTATLTPSIERIVIK